MIFNPMRGFSSTVLRWFLVAGVLMAVPLSAVAQSAGDGTVYSRFGVGELRSPSSLQAQPLGGSGTALRSLNYVSLSNPALWSDQELTRFSISANYQETSVEDAAGQTSRTVAGTLEGVHFSFPIYERTLGFAVGFQPVTRTNYRLVVPGTHEFGSPPETTDFERDFDGRGGLQEITGGLGYRINDAFSIGASANFIFGIIEETQRTNFATTEISTSELTDATRLRGVTGTVGALWSVDELLASNDNLSIGASVTLPANLSGTRTRTLGDGLDRDTLGTAADGSVDFPWRAKAGVSYQPDDRWIIALDGQFEPWSEFSSSFDETESGPGAFPVGGTDAVADRWRIGGGFEFLPAGESPQGEPFFSQLAYRLGGYAEQTYVKPTDTDQINVFAATGGISLPTGVAGTRIDLNTEVGTRGTTDSNLVRDVFYSITIGVNIGERWFQERLLR